MAAMFEDTSRSDATATPNKPSRGLLSEIIHEVLGEPADPRIENTILMSATKGQPVWARQFSNLRTPDEAVPAPERVYQAARFEGGINDNAEHASGPVVERYPSSFSVLDEWWQTLPQDQQLDELAKIRKGNRTYWRGVSGIFPKILTRAFTETKAGQLVMKKKPPKPVAEWMNRLGLTMPRLAANRTPDEMEKIMRTAVRAKLTSPEFARVIRDRLVNGKLPYYIAEAPLRGSGDGNRWVAPKETRTMVAKRK